MPFAPRRLHKHILGPAHIHMRICTKKHLLRSFCPFGFSAARRAAAAAAAAADDDAVIVNMWDQNEREHIKYNTIA